MSGQKRGTAKIYKRARTKRKAIVRSRPFPPPLDAARSTLMRAVRQSGTAPELAVRAACQHLGIRVRLNVRGLPGSPDLANKSRKFAIFVHGCFWHRHTGCYKTTTPSHNRSFWLTKFRANMRRDRQRIAALRSMGFRVIVVWECQTRDELKLRSRLRKLR
jgi:DNA mismatch endonuclease, patch repair protein